MEHVRIAMAMLAVDDTGAVGYVPHESRYTHTDVDGDRLLISTAAIGMEDGTVVPGIYFRTDHNGSSLPFEDLPGLIAQLQVIADAAREELTRKRNT